MKEITQELNTHRLLCPMPVIKTQNALKKMDKGELLRVICTDRGTLHDIPAWCKVNDYRLVEQCQQDDEYIFIIEA